MTETTIEPRLSCSRGLWGITNGHGAFWTDEVFRSEEAARQHMADFWKGPVPPKHCVIPVNIIIEPADPDKRKST